MLQIATLATNHAMGQRVNQGQGNGMRRILAPPVRKAFSPAR